ncbi:MAG: radical SAM protein [Candidatus Micrarchaeota archaeon]|nr:radical SAM protein [Candidatus Micrarchaeota archaeon]
MKVVMLNPPFLPRFSRQSRSPCVTKGGTFYYPYMLAYATGLLESEGFKVKLIDAVANNWSRKETVKFVKRWKPDLVVVDTSTPSIINDMEVADSLKPFVEHVTLVGTHPSAMPKWVLERCSADSVCIGEYDETIVDLASHLEKGKEPKIPGLVYRKGEKIVFSRIRKLIEDLDKFPFVSEVYLRHFGKEGMKKYFYASLKWPQVTILTARGCPYNCSFCNSPFKGSYRPRSVKNVVEEFEFIQSELKFVKEIMIEDETFPALKKRTIELCKELKRSGSSISWSANARVNTDFETLKIMKEAGLRLLCVGFESPEQRVLNDVSKGTTAKMQIKFMKNCRKLGILVNGCFILGLLEDTEKTIIKTIEFAKKLDPDTAQFYPLMVYPGTKDYERVKKLGYLETEDFSKWLTSDGQHRTTVSRPDLPSRRLEELCDLARKEFYLRPKYILRKFAQCLMDPQEGIRTAKSFRVFAKHLVGR